MDPLTLPPRDWILIHVNSSHIQRKEHPTMASIRRIVTQWGRRIAGGLILALLFSQMALAMYACPKPDSAGHIASMQAAGMAMEDPVDMPSLPDCYAMSGTMDDEAPQLCRAHCDSDGQLVSSLQGLDTQSIAAHAVCITYLLPEIFETQPTAGPMAGYVQPDPRAGFPPIYLALQVLRN